MLTTAEIIARIKKMHGDCSDYRVSKLLGITSQAVYQWTSGARAMGDETAIKAALLLKLDPDYVVACIAAERAKGSNAFTTWRHIAERLQPATRAA